ncbi:MAG: Zn-dependent alcohol dehydrogenase [Deltaproteobacteria bacterium]|nr:Zn-dependent alcohol dehydrogenase [Deltaproteobacteria bacterium]
MKAAVMRAFNAPLQFEEIEVGRPGPREVIVRTVATGVCHSDLHVIEAGLPVPPPLVLGHEPAGIVEAIGADVTHVVPGDHVIGCLSAFCGNCEYCLSGKPNLCGGAATMRKPGEPSRLTKGAETINQFAHLGSFAEKMLVHENAIVKIRSDMPLDRAALKSCGVTTGLGAVLNTARIHAGSTCVVVGCGGVGLSAIQGARIGGASRIIAVDTQPWKLELAKSLGATDGVNAKDGDAVMGVHGLIPGGVDYAFECLGAKQTVTQAFAMVKKGGTAVMVGVVPMGQMVEFPGLDLVLSGKKILGSMMGDNRFRTDMPRYVDFYLSGQLKLDEMISARLPLDRVNHAFDEMRKGAAARSVVVFES